MAPYVAWRAIGSLGSHLRVPTTLPGEPAHRACEPLRCEPQLFSADTSYAARCLFLCSLLYASAAASACYRGKPLPPILPVILFYFFFVRGSILPMIGPPKGIPVLAAVGGRPGFALVCCKGLTPHCMGEHSGSGTNSSRWLEARCGCLVSFFLLAVSRLIRSNRASPKRKLYRNETPWGWTQ